MKRILVVGLLLALLGIAASSLTGCVQGDLAMGGGGGSSSADNTGSNNPKHHPHRKHRGGRLAHVGASVPRMAALWLVATLCSLAACGEPPTGGQALSGRSAMVATLKSTGLVIVALDRFTKRRLEVATPACHFGGGPPQGEAVPARFDIDERTEFPRLLQSARQSPARAPGGFCLALRSWRLPGQAFIANPASRS